RRCPPPPASGSTRSGPKPSGAAWAGRSSFVWGGGPAPVNPPPPIQEWNMKRTPLTTLSAGRYDLLIIGGGITGASAFRDAALRGLKVALVEKNDFAWGTSSRSTKLLHGGLRYLESYQFRMVREACRERELMLK